MVDAITGYNIEPTFFTLTFKIQMWTASPYGFFQRRSAPPTPTPAPPAYPLPDNTTEKCEDITCRPWEIT